MTKNGMTKRGAKIQHHKRRGEWAEMCFMMRAAELGLEVSKPWSDTARYDFIIEKARRMARVQVKSTLCKHKDGYLCHVRDCRGKAHEGNPFDFVAAYAVPEDIWYIIPAKVLRGKTCIGLFPRYKRSKYEPFREAWHLLPGVSPDRGSTRTRVKSIDACAEEWISPEFLVPVPHGDGPQMMSAGI